MTSGVGVRVLPLAGREREDFGCIASIREQTRRRERVLHRGGRVTDALREIADQIDKLEGDWRVTCISTPTTIYRDLQGSRHANHNRFVSGLGYESSLRAFDEHDTERKMLGRIGRAELVEESARAPVRATRTGDRRRRA